jgi:hypothetical protein
VLQHHKVVRERSIERFAGPLLELRRGDLQDIHRHFLTAILAKIAVMSAMFNGIGRLA